MIKPLTAETCWPIRRAVMWPDRELEYVKLERDLTDGLHYGLFVGGEVVSIVSLFVDGRTAQFRKFATLKSQQNKGYGSQLLDWLITDKATELRLQKIWCNARKEKLNYYEKFGLHTTTNCFVKGGIEYVVMEKLILPR